MRHVKMVPARHWKSILILWIFHITQVTTESHQRRKFNEICREQGCICKEGRKNRKSYDDRGVEQAVKAKPIIENEKQDPFHLCDVVCGAGFGFPGKYCYGITAYCCGDQYQNCCWQEIWKVWWFWVVAFVIITAVFSCCGYYCSSTNDGYGGLVRRSSSFNMFRRFRRYSSIDESEAWKPYTPQVVLPPYTPSSSTSPVIGAVEPNPQQNLPYLEPPPPYTTVISRPQPPGSPTDNTSSPSAPSEAQNTSRSYVTTASTQ